MFSSFLVGEDTTRAIGLMGRGTSATDQTLLEEPSSPSHVFFLKKVQDITVTIRLFSKLSLVFIYT